MLCIKMPKVTKDLFILFDEAKGFLINIKNNAKKKKNNKKTQ